MSLNNELVYLSKRPLAYWRLSDEGVSTDVPIPHIYWRIAIQGNNGGTRISVAEIEMRAIIGGVDQCVGGVATASSEQTSAALAFDNDVNTDWQTKNNQFVNEYIAYEFINPVDVAELFINATNNAANLNQSPAAIVLEWSDDGIVFTEVGAASGLTWTLGEAKTFNSGGLESVMRDTTNRINGEYINAPTLGDPGQVDGTTAVTFDGVDQYALISPDSDDFNFTQSDPFSVAFWFKVALLGDIGSLVSKMVGTSWNVGWDIYFRSDGKVQIRISSGTNSSSNSGWLTSAGLANDQWHFYVATFNGSGIAQANINVYADGKLDNSTGEGISSVAGSPASAAIPCIGCRDEASQFFEGSIQEVAIFGHELSAEDVRNMYYAGRNDIKYKLSAILNDPLAYWRLGEDVVGGATVAVDSTVFSNDAAYAGTLPLVSAAPLINGTADGSLSFNGSDQSANRADVNNNAATMFSIWFATTTTNDVCLISYNALSGARHVVGISLNTLVVGELAVIGFTNPTVAVGGGLPIATGLNDGAAHNIVIGWSGTAVTAFIDGIKVPVANDSVARQWGDVVHTYVGRLRSENSFSNPFLGVLDEVVIYPSNLTDAQAHTLYAQGKRILKSGFSFHAIAPGPITYWRLGEDAGPTANDLMQRLNGTYQGTPTFQVPGLLVDDTNKAVTFSGSEYIDAGNNLGFDFFHELSISLLLSTTNVSAMTLVSKMDISGPHLGYSLDLVGGLLEFKIFAAGVGNGISVISTGVAINDGGTYLAVATYDGSGTAGGMDLYVNRVIQGVTLTGGPLATSVLNTASFNIGARNNLNQQFVGTLDEVLVYNSVLSTLEIRRLYWTSLGFFGIDLAYLELEPNNVWTMDDVGPTNIVDVISGSDGIATGAPSFEQAGLIRARPDGASIRFSSGLFQYVDMGSTAIFSTLSNFTFIMFIEVTSTDTENILWTELNGSTEILRVRVQPDNTVEFLIFETFTTHTAVSTGFVLPGKVYMIVVTMDSVTGMQIYIDGLPDGSNANTNIPSDAVDAVVMASDGSLSHYDGYIDSVAAVDFAMAAVDVNNMYTTSLVTEDVAPFAPIEVLLEQLIIPEVLQVQLGATAISGVQFIDAPGLVEMLTDALFVLDTLVVDRTSGLQAVDTIVLEDVTPGVIVGKTVIEALLLNDDLASIWKTDAAVIEQITMLDLVRLAFIMTASDVFVIEDALDTQILKGVVLVDILVMSGLVSTELKAAMVVAEALLLRDLVESGKGADVIEGLVLAEELIDLYNAIVAQLDTVIFSESVEPIFQINMVTADTAEFEDTLSVNWRIIEALRDGIVFGGSIVLPDGTYTAMVLNTESLGISEYDNFPFNSFGRIGQTYLGATDTDIYQLSGADDAGVDIDSVIRSGMTNFGTNLFKRVPRAYLGYTSDGALILKTFTTSSVAEQHGKQIERWYELTPRSADAPAAARIKLGRGIKATYWQFELINKAGADFDITSLQLFPMILNRRV